jgi:hypothetical protein
MIKLIAVTLFCLSVTVSAQAMTPAPISLPQPDAMITEVAVGCGPGRTRVDGICAACAGREVFARCTSEANEIDVRIHKPDASDFAELPGRRE